MTPARFRWGMLLVLAGSILLLHNSGYIDDFFFADSINYSMVILSVLLIAIGIEKIFTKTRLQFISYLTTLLLFGGAILLAVSGSLNGSTNSFFAKSTLFHDFDPGVRKIRAILSVDNTDLTIRDSGDDLFTASFEEYTRKPVYDFSVRDSIAELELKSRQGSFMGGIVRINTNAPQDWRLRFCDRIPLELECRGSEADIHLNFSTTPLQILKLDADEAQIYIVVGNLEPYVAVNISGDESRLKLRIPQSSGLIISGDDYDAYLRRIGLRKRKNGFVNDGFDSLENKIEVNLESRLESLTIDFF